MSTTESEMYMPKTGCVFFAANVFRSVYKYKTTYRIDNFFLTNTVECL